MNFDRVAPYYQLIERVTAGNAAQKCRTTLLGYLQNKRNILLLGEGNGRFLETLLQVAPAARITVVDSSPRMMTLLRQRMDKQGVSLERVKLVEADVRDWVITPKVYDAMVTNFFLDCFRPVELQSLIHRLAESIREDGLWLIADFREPPQLMRRVRAKVILKLMYGFFRRTTKLSAKRLTAPDEHLEDAGFRLQERELQSLGLMHADVWRKT
ncbi:MAG: class I SAM-dependent methyltransferase [Limisphaerales bacterium]